MKFIRMRQYSSRCIVKDKIMFISEIFVRQLLLFIGNSHIYMICDQELNLHFMLTQPILIFYNFVFWYILWSQFFASTLPISLPGNVALECYGIMYNFELSKKKTLSEMKVVPPNKLLTVTLFTLPVNKFFLGFEGKKWKVLN